MFSYIYGTGSLSLFNIVARPLRSRTGVTHLYFLSFILLLFCRRKALATSLRAYAGAGFRGSSPASA